MTFPSLTFHLPFTTLLFKPALPPLIIILLLALLLILAYYSTIRRPASRTVSSALPLLIIRWLLFIFRAAALSALAIFLLNPVTITTAEIDAPTPNRPILNILIDHSQSMATRDIISPNKPENPPLSRFREIQKKILNPAFLDKLNTSSEPRFYLLGSELLPITSDQFPDALPDSDDSRLTEQLQSFLRNSIPDSAPILLLTDGRDTTGRALTELIPDIRVAGIPLYIVPLGSPRKQPDYALRLFADQSRIITGQHTTLRATITKTGITPQYAEVTLKQNNHIINRRRIQLHELQTRLEFDITPRPATGITPLPGEIAIADYQMTITPFPGEQNTDNNSRHAFIEISDEKIRILLLENEPYWDTRFLIRALRADPKIELTTIIGLNNRVQHINRYRSYINNNPNSDQYDHTEPLDPFGIGSGSPVEIPIPKTAQQLRQYDIVILGKGIERWFPDKSAITLTRFVIDEGGSIVFARGTPCNADTEIGRTALNILSEISPVQWGEDILHQGGRLTRTPTGRLEQSLDFQPLGNTDLILSKLPGMIAQTAILHEKSLSTIWLRDEDNKQTITTNQSDRTNKISSIAPAAVAQQRIGKGQSLAILTHGLWQWALQPPDAHNLTKTFDLFWTRAIRFLAHQGEFLPGQSVNLTLSRLACTPGQSVSITVQTRYISNKNLKSGRLTIITPDGQSSVLPLKTAPTNHDLTSASYTPSAEGVYQVILDTPDLVPNRHIRYFAAYDFNRENVDTSADLPTLQALTSEPLVQLIDLYNPDQILNQLKIWSQSTRLIEKSLPKWDTIFSMVFVLLSLGMDWYLRRRVRLL